MTAALTSATTSNRSLVDTTGERAGPVGYQASSGSTDTIDGTLPGKGHSVTGQRLCDHVGDAATYTPFQPAVAAGRVFGGWDLDATLRFLASLPGVTAGNGDQTMGARRERVVVGVRLNQLPVAG